MIDVEIHGLDELEAKLNKLPSVLAEGAMNGQEDAIEQAEAYAVDELQSSIKYSQGELARSFKHEVKQDGDEAMVAIFREFGTGKVGENSPKKLPSNIAIAYRQTPWYIPAEEVDIDLNKIYGIPKIKIKGKYFYRTTGQPARQFMTPAMDKLAKEAPNIIKTRVEQEFRDKLGD